MHRERFFDVVTNANTTHKRAQSSSYIELPKLTGTTNHERSLVSLASVVVVVDAAFAVADDDDDVVVIHRMYESDERILRL